MLGFSFDWSYLSEHWHELLWGLARTLEVSGIAIAGAFAIGLVLGAVRAHRIPVASQLAAVYVEVIRNTPMVKDRGAGTIPGLARYRLAGRAFTVSEYNHPAPADYQAENLAGKEGEC